MIVRSITALSVSDTQSGYKLFHTDLFVNAMQKVTLTNASYDVALLYHIKKLGGHITEMPAKYSHANNGKLNPLSMTLSFGISLFAFMLIENSIMRHPKRYRGGWVNGIFIRRDNGDQYTSHTISRIMPCCLTLP